jgi:hypothetical protein
MQSGRAPFWITFLDYLPIVCAHSSLSSLSVSMEIIVQRLVDERLYIGE